MMRKCKIAGITALLISLGILGIFVIPLYRSNKQVDYSNNTTLNKSIDFELDEYNTFFDTLDKHGENVLLFWASWCPHCESLINDMKALDKYETLHEHLFTVSVGDSLEDASIHKGEFPIYLDENESIFKEYGLEHIPGVFILDGEGRIIGSAEGESESLSLLKAYIEKNTR